MARRKLPPGTKERALEMARNGVEPIRIAADLGVSLSSVHKWVNEGKSQGDAPIAGGLTGAPSTGMPSDTAVNAGIGGIPAPVNEGKGQELGSLIASHPGSGYSPGPELPPIAPEVPKPKPMDPEALIAVAGVAKAMIVQTVATFYKVELTPEMASQLCGFSEAEKKSLQTLAPFAAEYTGQMEQYAKPGMALLFAGAVSFSTINSLRALKKMRQPRQTKKGAKKNEDVNNR